MVDENYITFSGPRWSPDDAMSKVNIEKNI